MSQGAIFKLMLRDERFDRFFTASDYLRQRLNAARARAASEAGGAGAPPAPPTFADIEKTHLLYIHAAYRPYVSVASEYTRIKPIGDNVASVGAAGGTIQFTFPSFGHFTSDMMIHVRVRAAGSPAATAPSAANPYLRFCALPGVRLLRRVELRSDQTLVDDYTADDVVAHSKFFVRADQRAGWDRCMGQQELREAAYLSNGFTGSLLYRDGPQTPKLYHEAFDLFIPLQFWFCRDAAHALLNDLAPSSQRTITCEMAPLKDILQALLPSPSNPSLLVPAELPVGRLPFEVSLYVNSLYVNPEIHELFASRVGFSLIRVHRRQVNQLQSSMDAFLMDQLKFPAEYLLLGFRSRALASDFDRWWLMGAPRARTNATRLQAPAMIWNATLGINQLVSREATEVTSLESPLDTLGVTAHGIEIFPLMPGGFYNAYMPLRYGDSGTVVSPTDPCAFLVNFCLYPGRYNPSGYYNLSAGREMYVNYVLKSANADFASGSLEMVTSMSALNFLVRRGDKIHLRYSV
jgi:hypothetical protein